METVKVFLNRSLKEITDFLIDKKKIRVEFLIVINVFSMYICLLLLDFIKVNTLVELLLNIFLIFVFSTLGGTLAHLDMRMMR